MSVPVKSFPTADVLSTITGVLVSEIGGVYQVCNWMTGEDVYTHQLPRICREAQPVLIAAHPALAAACQEADQVNPENFREWRDRWIERYGPTLDVPKFTADDHERIDPFSELVEKVPPDRIIVIGKDPR